MLEEGDRVVNVRDPVGYGIGEVTESNIISSAIRFPCGHVYVENHALIKVEDFFDLLNPGVWVIDDATLTKLVSL